MARRNKKGKSKKGKDPESSTPETSINSVDDDTQQLLRSGAGASTDGRKSRADEKTKKYNRWTFQRNPPSCQSLDATSSRNSPQSGLATDPDPESSTRPSKKLSLSPFQNPWGKKSANRSPGTECSCEVGNHKPECPKSKDLPVDPKGASGGAITKAFSAKKDKANTKSSSSSGGAISKTFSAKKDEANTKSSSSSGGVISKKFNAMKSKVGSKPFSPFGGEGSKTSRTKKNDGTQSSSSSDPPSVTEYYASASESQQSSERSLLLDPNRGAGVHPAGSSKKITHATRVLEKFKTIRQGNRSSSTESSLEEKANEELKCPEQRKHKMDPRSKSQKGKTPKQSTLKTTSSSGSSASTKNKNSDESYQLPRCLNSKSSTKSDPKGKRPLKGPSGKKSSNKSKSNAGSYSISTESGHFEELFDRSETEHDTLQGAIGGYEPEIQNDILIDQEPEMQNDEILIGQMDLGRRRRIPSGRTRSHLQESEPNPLDPNQGPFNLSQMNAEIGAIDWERVHERNQRVENQKDADEEIDVNEERNASIEENEQVLLRRLGRVQRPDPRVLRNPSFSPVRVRPCSCRAASGCRITGHSRYCDQERDLRRLRQKRKNRFD